MLGLRGLRDRAHGCGRSRRRPWRRRSPRRAICCRRDRHGRVLARRVGRARDRARDHDLALHGPSSPVSVVPTASASGGETQPSVAATSRTAIVQSALKRRLHPIVRCAKPRTPPWNDRMSGRFGGLSRTLAVRREGRGGIRAGLEREGRDERTVAGLSAARRLHRRWRSCIGLALLVAPFIVAYKSPTPRSSRPTNAASTPSTTRA